MEGGGFAGNSRFFGEPSELWIIGGKTLLFQLRDCEIVKFIHKDSIEQQMQTIQDKKRELISGAFQQSPRQAREQRMQEIRDIFGIPSNQS